MPDVLFTAFKNYFQTDYVFGIDFLLINFFEERQLSEIIVNESSRSIENYSQELVSETWKFLFST
jgi:hypothetical protein